MVDLQMGCVSKAVTVHEVTVITVIMAYDVHHWAAQGSVLGTVNWVTPSRKDVDAFGIFGTSDGKA